MEVTIDPNANSSSNPIHSATLTTIEAAELMTGDSVPSFPSLPMQEIAFESDENLYVFDLQNESEILTCLVDDDEFDLEFNFDVQAAPNTTTTSPTQPPFSLATESNPILTPASEIHASPISTTPAATPLTTNAERPPRVPRAPIPEVREKEGFQRSLVQILKEEIPRYDIAQGEKIKLKISGLSFLFCFLFCFA